MWEHEGAEAQLVTLSCCSEKCTDSALTTQELQECSLATGARGVSSDPPLWKTRLKPKPEVFGV